MSQHQDLSPDALRSRMKRARKRENFIHLDTGRGLRVVKDQKYYRHWGYSSLQAYGEAELDLSKRQVRERIRLTRALEDLPMIRRALELKKIKH